MIPDVGALEMEHETPSKLKPQSNASFQNPRSLRIGVALLIILVSVLAGGIFIFRNGLSDLLSKRRVFYTVVLDCGSTGTRVNVYKWTVKGSDNGGNLPVLLHSYPENFGESHGCQYHCVQTVPGLDKFVANASGVRVALEPLIHLAEQWVPSDEHHATPMFVMGTAGMRGLSSNDARQVLEDVEDVVKEHRFLFRKEWIRVLTGKEEAYYGWIALNYEMGIFRNRSMSPTLGLLDLGGSSLQVVTEADELGEDEHIFTSKVGSFENHIVARSLPGFGFSKAFDRTVSMLRQSHDTTITESMEGVIEIRHPCLEHGFLENYTCHHCVGLSSGKARTISSHMEDSNLGVVRLVGGSNWKGCKAFAAAAAINSSKKELSQHDMHSDCRGFYANGGSTKLNMTVLYHADQRFYAVSGFYAIYKKLKLSSGANLTNLKEAGERLCQGLNTDRNNISGQDCFQVAYTISLIEDALCLGNANIGFGPGDISWTLGAALIEGNYLWLSSAKSRNVILSSTNREYMSSSPVIVFVFLSFVLFVVYRSQIKIPMLGRKTASVRTPLPSYICPKRQPS